MNYRKIYSDICKRGQTRTLPEDVYTERHHIIPKSMGGGNDPENMTTLTAREHFLVHYILSSKIYPNSYKMLCALSRMVFSKNKQQIRYIPSSRVYEFAKKRLSESQKGIKNSFYGKKHSKKTKEIIREYKKNISKETRRRMSRAKKGKKLSESHIKNIIAAMTGRKRSEETKRKMSEAIKGEKHHMYGKTHSKESRRKMSESHKIRMSSKELIKKMSEANKGSKNPFYGRIHSEESKKKMSEAAKRRWQKNKKNNVEV